MTHPFSRITPTALQIDETTLVDVCDLLEADTIEVDETVVTFTKVLATSDRQRWTGTFGEWVVADGAAWCVVPDPSTQLAWARTA